MYTRADAAIGGRSGQRCLRAARGPSAHGVDGAAARDRGHALVRAAAAGRRRFGFFRGDDAGPAPAAERTRAHGGRAAEAGAAASAERRRRLARQARGARAGRGGVRVAARDPRRAAALCRAVDDSDRGAAVHAAFALRRIPAAACAEGDARGAAALVRAVVRAIRNVGRFRSCGDPRRCGAARDRVFSRDHRRGNASNVALPRLAQPAAPALLQSGRVEAVPRRLRRVDRARPLPARTRDRRASRRGLRLRRRGQRRCTGPAARPCLQARLESGLAFFYQLYFACFRVTRRAGSVEGEARPPRAVRDLASPRKTRRAVAARSPGRARSAAGDESRQVEIAVATAGEPDHSHARRTRTARSVHRQPAQCHRLSKC